MGVEQQPLILLLAIAICLWSHHGGASKATLPWHQRATKKACEPDQQGIVSNEKVSNSSDDLFSN